MTMILLSKAVFLVLCLVLMFVSAWHSDSGQYDAATYYLLAGVWALHESRREAKEGTST